MPLDEVVIAIGSVAVKHILKLWFRDGSFANDASSSLVDMLKAKTSDGFARRKGALQLEEIGTQISESLYPLFERESRLDEGERVYVAEAVRDAFSRAHLSTDLLIEKNLDPVYLARLVLDSSPTATRLMSEAAATLYERTIQETCAYIVTIATQLPAFTEHTFAEILKRENQLITIAKASLDMLRKMQEHLDPAIEAEDFERKYREAVARNLDILQLIGADVSLPNRRHRLSVAYISLTVEHKRALSPVTGFSASTVRNVSTPDQDEQADPWETLPAHTALSRSRRLLIRGQAGSGKTTLLQWVAVRAASRSFEGDLADWNGTLPFYIRLRSYAQNELPRPEMFTEPVAPMIVERMPKGWVHTILESGRGMVLIDGVDEIAAAQREAAHTWLNDLVATYPRARFIVTSRPHAIEEGWMNRLPFDDAELQPMDLADISAFITHWHDAVCEEVQTEEERRELAPLADHLKEQVKHHLPLRRLATSPLLCAMLCALNRDRRQHLPANRTELYRACCELLLERREKESRIDLRDYPALNLGQKERLLQDIAYWLLQENLSEADKAHVDERLAAQLATMVGISPDIKGSAVRRLFVERSGILREPVVGRIDFTHRTFEEFYTAQAALQASGAEQLLVNAHLDQWREVIILAAGLASQAVSEQLIAGLLQRGDDEPEHRHLLHLLAVSCLETVIQLRSEARAEVEQRMKSIVPPKNMAEAKAVAAAGDLAVRYLLRSGKRSTAVSAASIRALALVGSGAALDALETYADDTREGVRKELLKSWDVFDRKIFARRIFSHFSSIKLERVTTLEGLEYALGLTSLDLSGCKQLTDVSPLAHLTNLISLNLSGCEQLTAVSLTDLPNLTFLDQSECWQLTTVTLAGLPNLTSLNLSGCRQLITVTLTDLPNLTSLDLNKSRRLTTVTLAGLPNLTSLGLSWRGQLTTVTLTGLPSLTSLDLNKSRRLTAVTLAGLSSLTSLNLSGCEQLNRVSLIDLSNLTTLNLYRCERLTDITWLAHLANLTTLNLSRCERLTDINPLVHLANLTTLNLSGYERLTDINPLVHLTNLTTLNLSRCERLTDITWLAHLANLTSLDLSGYERLTDITPLAHLTNLTSLNLPGCRPLTDITPLAHLTNLTFLNLSGCGQLTDISPLVHLTNLTFLKLSSCERLTTVSLTDLPSLTSLDLSWCRRLTDISPLAHLTNLTSLNLSGCGQLTGISPLANMTKIKIKR